MINLFGEQTDHIGTLRDKFIVPPFSILNSSNGAWQKRKRMWMSRIGDTAQSRQNTLRRCGHEPHTKNWQFMAIKGDTTSILDPVLCEVLLHWFTMPGHHTLDPFAGDTAFGYVSASMGRPFMGIELRSEQVLFNQKSVDQLNLPAKYICDDARNINAHIPDNSVDFIFSCPPYADLEIYSDDPRDLSTMDYDMFFRTISDVLVNTIMKLKENRFACIVIGEVRHKRTGCYIGLVPKIIEIMCNNGMQYYNDIVLQTPIGNLHMRAGRYMETNRKVGKQHQNILVFYKGNPNKIKEYFKIIDNEC